MENLNLGKIITTEQQRDAIHIAVAPVIAAQKLSPGQHVAVIGTEAWADTGEPVGVVDPYLKAEVKKGQKFWLFLYPGSITSLRHEWSHPSLTGPALFDTRKAAAEEWLRGFAEDHCFDYDEMVSGAISGSGACAGQDFDNYTIRENTQFWEHIGTVAGKHMDETHRENTYFRCAC